MVYCSWYIGLQLLISLKTILLNSCSRLWSHRLLLKSFWYHVSFFVFFFQGGIIIFTVQHIPLKGLNTSDWCFQLRLFKFSSRRVGFKKNNPGVFRMCWWKWAVEQGEFIKNSKICSMKKKRPTVGSTTKLKSQLNQAVLSKPGDFCLAAQCVKVRRPSWKILFLGSGDWKRQSSSQLEEISSVQQGLHVVTGDDKSMKGRIPKKMKKIHHSCIHRAQCWRSLDIADQTQGRGQLALKCSASVQYMSMTLEPWHFVEGIHARSSVTFQMRRSKVIKHWQN